MQAVSPSVIVMPARPSRRRMVTFGLTCTEEARLAAHDELLSLRTLVLRGREVAFTRAFLVWRREGQTLTWSGNVRGGDFGSLIADGEEVGLSATTLDGRGVEGRATLRLDGPDGPLALLGSGPLLVAGREL